MMHSVFWSLLVLLGSVTLQPVLSATHTRLQHPGNWQHLHKDTDVVFPLRVSASGQPYAHAQEHFVKRKRRSAPDDIPDDRDPDRDPDRDQISAERKYYTFTAFKKQLELQLTRDANFIAPNVVVERVGVNGSQMWIREPESRHCYYSGKVKGDPWSAVTLSLCDRMMGSIFAFNEQFFIDAHPDFGHAKQNGTEWNPSGTEADRGGTEAHPGGIPHVVYRVKKRSQSEGSTNSDKQKSFLDDTPNASQSEATSGGSHSRKKRGSDRLLYGGAEVNYVELMVVADAEMEEFHGDGLDDYIFVLMGLVASIYQNHTLENNINIVVKRVVVLESEEAGPRVSTNAANTLRNFCQWQYQQNVKNASSPLHHDTALLITKKNICRTAKNCETLGLAELGTICDPYRSCSIAEDNGLSTAFTIAHELGHVFSLPHDDDKSCRKYPGTGRGQYHLMAPTLDYTTNPWSWSDCSAARMTEFILSPSAKCLHNQPRIPNLQYFAEKKSGRSDERQPGELYNVNKQCEKAYGVGSRLCPYTHEMHNEINEGDLRCTRLWCTNVSPSGGYAGCRTQHMPWADGTKCGHHMWCIMGKCIRRRRLVAVDGGWGEWIDFGECSRTCGGGVKKSMRKCNRPPPKFGGKFCTGDSVRYASCNTQNCFSSGVDTFREEQCAKHNGNNYNIERLSPTVKWSPIYNGHGDDRCKLFCQADTDSAFYFPLEDKVVDGTKCHPDSSDICVNGRCVPAGCDNILGSTKKRDQCGVCDGDGTMCQTIKHHFNPTMQDFGYNQVAVIRKGASNIRIEQHGYRNQKEDNIYLALRDSHGDYILNGNWVVSVHRKKIHVKGSVLEYSGSDHIVEVINGTRMIDENLILMVLAVGKLNPPNITYTYTVPQVENIKFRWGKRTEYCRSTCGNGRRKIAVCLRLPDRQKVLDAYCEKYLGNKPRYGGGNCSDECTLQWRMVFQSKCSAKCGAGFLKQHHKCYRSSHRHHTAEVVSHNECEYHVGPMPAEKWPCHSLCLTPEWNFGEWSKCTKSCGGGYQYRRAICKDGSGKPVQPTECEIQDRIISQRCNTEECPAWVAGDWLQCSSRCGEGVQQRHLWCKQGGTTVSKTLCDPSAEPYRTQACNQGPCATWRVGHWGECSTTCGNTLRSREVRCIDETGGVIDESHCDSRKKPTKIEICRQPPCTTPTTTTTSTTTTTTSTTTTTQTTTTHRKPTTAIASPLSSQVPITQHSNPMTSAYSRTPPRKPTSDVTVITAARTNTRPQTYATWRTGSWTECSATCGTGIHERYVSCRDRQGKRADESSCSYIPKPPSREYCTMPPCGQWRTGDWAPCPVTCGGAKTTRLVACVIQDDLQEQRTSHTQCDKAIMPEFEQLCNTHECVSPEQYDIHSISTNRAENTAHWRVGPWSGCSVTCGGGSQRRAVVCMDEQGTSAICEASQQPPHMLRCNDKPCPIWRSGSWGKCSQSCDGGLQYRIVVCQLPSGGDRLDPHDCDFVTRPSGSQNCNTHSCEPSDQSQEKNESRNERVSTRWYKGPWSQCSVTCGRGGVRRRQVACVNTQGLFVDDNKCNTNHRPKTNRRCRQQVCPKWRSSKWGQCSVECGQGIMTRSVECVGAKRRTLAQNKCSHIPQPNNSMPCEANNCGVYLWRTEEWSKCSSTCGPGQKIRAVFCLRADTTTKVNDSYCHNKRKPGEKQQCSMQPCPYMWLTSDWSQCSRTCGKGIQTRTVTCHALSKEGWIIQDNARICNTSDEPLSSRMCIVSRCGSRYHWTLEPWQSCQSQCGFGIQQRKMYCVDENNQRVRSRKCPRRFKPIKTKLCYSQPCYASSCKELQMLSSIRQDGEYRLLKTNQLISVFCYNMDRSQPREYISLNTNNEDNFATVFHKRLKNPDRCLASNDDCADCFSSRGYSKAGQTHFTKVRLNVTNLQIITNDYLFSTSTNGYRKISYGEAGDCYSTDICPKGLFMINLEGTNFRVSATAKWISTGSDVSMKIVMSEDRQRVKGTCGGYCGHCEPEHMKTIQLDLMPT